MPVLVPIVRTAVGVPPFSHILQADGLSCVRSIISERASRKWSDLHTRLMKGPRDIYALPATTAIIPGGLFQGKLGDGQHAYLPTQLCHNDDAYRPKCYLRFLIEGQNPHPPFRSFVMTMLTDKSATSDLLLSPPKHSTVVSPFQTKQADAYCDYCFASY